MLKTYHFTCNFSHCSAFNLAANIPNYNRQNTTLGLAVQSRLNFEEFVARHRWCCRPTYTLGHGHIGARTDTTQQSEQTPDKEIEIKNINVYVSGYTETPDSRWR